MLYWLTLTMQWLSRRHARQTRWQIGGFVAQVVYWLWAEKRRATIFNMSIVLGLPERHPRVQRAARLSWRNYGRFSTDLFDIANHPAEYYLKMLTDLTGPPEPDGTIRGMAIVEEARARGKGVIIPTAHFGNWDVAGMLVAERGDLYVIAEALKDERLNQLLQRQRKAKGMIVLMIEDALRPMMRVLRDGGIVATPVDRPLPPGEGVPVRFFGRTTYVPRGMSALAVKLGASIVPGFVWYGRDGGFRARVCPPVVITPSGDTEADIIRATQVMYDALEAQIREDPTQWYMFRRFWPAEDVPASGRTAQATETARHE